FFYHYLDMKTGERFEDSELSTVDTAILLAGVLFCQSYFSGPEREEVEIRDLAEEIYRRVDWRWAQPNVPAISHGWTREDGFFARSRTITCAGGGWTTSRTVAVRCTRSRPTRSPIRCAATITARPSGASRPATARPTSSSRTRMASACIEVTPRAAPTPTTIA